MPIKYMGSKNRIAKYIVPIIQNYIDTNNIDTYIEPFCGGANVIDKIKCKNKIGSDINKYLIALLNYAKEPNNIFPAEIDRQTYNDVRNFYNNNKNCNNYKDWFVGCVGFLASYNGRFFDGGYAKNGYEKTKNGLRYRNYYQEALNNLVKQSNNLRDCTLICCDYLEYKDKNIKNAVIYLDPPYQNTKQFQNAKDFNYVEFWNFARYISKDNICIISELNAPNDFECIWEQEVSRSIKANDKSKAVEKLFIHKNGRQ